MKKKVAFVALCFLILTSSAFAELTQPDLDKIQSIVDRSVSKVEESVKTSEKHIMQYIELKNEALDGRMGTFEKHLKQYIELKVETLDGQLKLIFTLMIALIALIAVAVGMPQILATRQGKEIRTQEQQIKALQQEIEMLKQELMAGS